MLHTTCRTACDSAGFHYRQAWCTLDVRYTVCTTSQPADDPRRIERRPLFPKTAELLSYMLNIRFLQLEKLKLTRMSPAARLVCVSVAVSPI